MTRLKSRLDPPMTGLMLRLAVIAAVVATIGASANFVAAAPATPPCPAVEGWTFSRTVGPIDKSISVQFVCEYMRPGQPEVFSLDVDWVKPIARDVDVDFNECKRPSEDHGYYRMLWSGKAFVRLEYIVNSGTSASNAALFAADRERFERSALAFLAATEKLAKPCAKQSVTPPADTRRPTVRVERASGKSGTPVTFAFRIADNSPPIGVTLTIYDSRKKDKVAFRKDYGKAKSGSYTVKIRPRSRGVHLWCLTARDAAGNAATACSKLVVR